MTHVDEIQMRARLGDNQTWLIAFNRLGQIVGVGAYPPEVTRPPQNLETLWTTLCVSRDIRKPPCKFSFFLDFWRDAKKRVDESRG